MGPLYGANEELDLHVLWSNTKPVKTVQWGLFGSLKDIGGEFRN